MKTAIKIILLLFLILTGFILLKNIKPVKVSQKPVPSQFFPYKKPDVPLKRSYLTMLVGDSMTDAFGINANMLRESLIRLYPKSEFVNYNYGFGSTNILSLFDRLTSESVYMGRNYPPILSQGFDLIIIESFAYNPLSQFPLKEGLNQHEAMLDKSIIEIMTKKPNSVIALMTPIAPSKDNFAKGTVNLTPAQRKQWITERTAYISKHIEYARKRNIPLINVYEKSLLQSGDANPKYINPSDNIHPSKEGLKLMADSIAEYIFQNNIFPQKSN